MYKLIDGKIISQNYKDLVKEQSQLFNEKIGRQITLAVIIVGNDSASEVYVKNKIKASEYVGFKSLLLRLPDNAKEEEVIDVVESLNNDKFVDGILVQLPLPKHINESNVLMKIMPEKDVDGFLPYNVGNLLLGNPCTVSCTPLGVIKLLESTNVDLKGLNAVVVGRSNIVGKPMALLLLEKNCTVTVCHSKTRNLKDILKKADIIVAAIGKPKFIKANMVKKGVIIIDVGINRLETGLCGDVDFDNVKKKSSYITPVPGGVGPMTIAMLLLNTLNCALRRENVQL